MVYCVEQVCPDAGYSDCSGVLHFFLNFSQEVDISSTVMQKISINQLNWIDLFNVVLFQGCRWTDCPMGRLINQMTMQWCTDCDISVYNGIDKYVVL